MSGEEYIDVLDEEGRRIGTKSRTAVHRDGDLHALVFVWAARRDESGQVRLLLQVRARPGDPFAGKVDAPAGGHVTAGETPAQGARREFAEEVGVQLRADELAYLGCMRLENPVGPCRRVMQYFYLCTRRIGLEDVAFNEEVDGFVMVGLEDFVAVLEGKAEEVIGVAKLAAVPARRVELQIQAAALASYGPAILDVFRRSMQAVRMYVKDGAVDAAIWQG